MISDKNLLFLIQVDRFLLHASTKVKINKEHKDFYRINFSDLRSGG